MTTNISTIFDAMDTLISTELTDYARIPNAYDMESNANLFVLKGYAIGLGAATNTERQLSCQLSLNRTFNILLTNQVTANYTDFDAFNDVAKTLFEDQYKIIKAIEKSPTINSGQVFAKFVGDGGLEFLVAGQAKYFMVEMQFDCEYFENLNS